MTYLFRPYSRGCIFIMTICIAACANTPSPDNTLSGQIDGTDSGQDVGTDSGQTVGTDSGQDVGTDSGQTRVQDLLNLDVLRDLTGDAVSGTITGRIVGKWRSSKAWATYDTVLELNLDGSGSKYYDGMDEEPQLFTWQLDGNILSMSTKESAIRDGAECVDEQIAFTTISIDNDWLYTDALIRTEGSSDEYDGTWKTITGKLERYECDGEYERSTRYDSVELTLSGDNFTSVIATSYVEEWSFDGESGGDDYSSDLPFSGDVLIPFYSSLLYLKGPDSDFESYDMAVESVTDNSMVYTDYVSSEILDETLDNDTQEELYDEIYDDMYENRFSRQ